MLKTHASKTVVFRLHQLFFGEKELCVFGQDFVLPFLFFMEKICSFFGHRDVHRDLSNALKIEIENAINDYGITTFYVGDRGAFDRQAVGAVRSIKHQYPDVRLVLVLPYFTNKLNEYKEYYEQTYDEIYIPTELADVHPKGAISKRNRLMIDSSELVICYVNHTYGGAYDALKYAQRNSKRIIHID